KYFFWDAYYKGLLLSDPDRDRRLAELIPEADGLEREFGRKEADKRCLASEVQQELRQKMCLDSALYFSDLWNTLAYTCFHTVWTAHTGGTFTRARKHFRDSDPGAAPLAVRYAHDNDGAMTHVRGACAHRCLENAGAEWVEDSAAPAWPELDRSAAFS